MTAEAFHSRGEVWSVDFGSRPSDPEQAFQRPALVVSDDRLHHPRLRLLIVVPGTTTIRDVSLHVVVEPDALNGLSSSTAFQVEQVRAIATTRLVSRLGRLDATSRRTVDELLRTVLRLA